MTIETWRDRLRAALNASGKSMRGVSLATGHGAGYLGSILTEGKDPTIDRLDAVCREIGVSVSYVLYGVDVTREQEELLTLLKEASPSTRQAIFQILKDKSAS